MYFPMTNLGENFYLCITKAFHTPFSQKDRKICTFTFYQKKEKEKCYMITQDDNKAEKREYVWCKDCRWRFTSVPSEATEGVPEHEVEDNIQIPQNTFRWCKMRFGTISKTERRTIRAGFYLKVSKRWLSLSCGWELKENMDWTTIVSSQRYGVWTAVLEMDYNSSLKYQEWRIKTRTWTGWGDVSVPHLNWWLVATLQGRTGKDLFVCQRGLHSHSCWTFIEF